MEAELKKRDWGIAQAGILVFVLLLLLLSISEKDRLRAGGNRHRGMLIENGAALFQPHCGQCHGPRGEGMGQLGPPLSSEHFFSERLGEVGWLMGLEEYIIAVIEQGRLVGTRPMYAGNGSTAVMAPFHGRFGGPLRTDQVEALTAFILNWESTAKGTVVLETLQVATTMVNDPERISAGERVFTKSCMQCHSISGGGERATGTGPDLRGIAEKATSRRDGISAAEYIKESVTIPGAYVVKGFESAAEKNPCSVVLGKSELASVTAFLLHSE